MRRTELNYIQIHHIPITSTKWQPKYRHNVNLCADKQQYLVLLIFRPRCFSSIFSLTNFFLLLFFYLVRIRIWHTKDDFCLYMLFEYVVGGELFTYLRNAGKFNNSTGKLKKLIHNSKNAFYVYYKHKEVLSNPRRLMVWHLRYNQSRGLFC